MEEGLEFYFESKICEILLNFLLREDPEIIRKIMLT